MKTFFLILFPLISYSQEVINDTIYLKRENNIYYLISEINYSDNEILYNKKLLGDSLSTINYLINNAENSSSFIAIHAKEFYNSKNYKKNINYYNNLHQQISGRPVYTSTALRDSTAFLGDWTLVFNGENILGEIQLNNANRLIFNPDNGKVYTISTNLLLSTFTNQITFSFNGVRYDLYKFGNGRFATVDNDVKLIKKE